MLCTPGKANDGEAEKDAEDKMSDGKPESGDQQPDKVQQQGKATRQLIVDLKGAAKRPQAQQADFNKLESEGDADDGEHHDQSTPNIPDRSGKAAEDQPDDIAEEVHPLNIIIFVPSTI